MRIRALDIMPKYPADQNQIWLDGSLYKIGAHGKAFMRIDGRWVVSSKKPVIVKNALRSELKKTKRL